MVTSGEMQHSIGDTRMRPMTQRRFRITFPDYEPDHLSCVSLRTAARVLSSNPHFISRSLVSYISLICATPAAKTPHFTDRGAHRQGGGPCGCTRRCLPAVSFEAAAGLVSTAPSADGPSLWPGPTETSCTQTATGSAHLQSSDGQDTTELCAPGRACACVCARVCACVCV